MNQPLPVICDLCRASGLTGEAPFAELGDLLSFTPVPRRSHVNGWDGERQRAFIAALVATGSPRRAASAIGRQAFGAVQLRRARGGASFAAAWDAALDISRERELAGLRDGLTELAAEAEEERIRRRSMILPRAERDTAPSSAAPSRSQSRREEREEAAAERFADVTEAKERIAARLTNARRMYLKLIAGDRAKRKAWDTLCGPADWDAAKRGRPQPDEALADDHQPLHNIHQPQLLLTFQSGLLAEFTGGPDPLDPLRRAVATPHPAEDEADLSPEDQAAIATYRQSLRNAGWTEDEDGNLWSPHEQPA